MPKVRIHQPVRGLLPKRVVSFTSKQGHDGFNSMTHDGTHNLMSGHMKTPSVTSPVKAPNPILAQLQ